MSEGGSDCWAQRAAERPSMSTSDRRTWAPRLSALNVMCARAVSVFECPRTAMHLPVSPGSVRAGAGVASRGRGVSRSRYVEPVCPVTTVLTLPSCDFVEHAHAPPAGETHDTGLRRAAAPAPGALAQERRTQLPLTHRCPNFKRGWWPFLSSQFGGRHCLGTPPAPRPT